PVTTIVLFGLPICVPAGKPVTECFTFNSSGAAASFAAGIDSKSDALTAQNGSQCSPHFNTTTISPAPGTCAEGDGSMVAYDRTQEGDVQTPGSISDADFNNVQS